MKSSKARDFEAEMRKASEEAHFKALGDQLPVFNQRVDDFVKTPPKVPATQDEGLAASKALNLAMRAFHYARRRAEFAAAVAPFAEAARRGLVPDVHFHFNVALNYAMAGAAAETVEFLKSAFAFAGSPYRAEHAQYNPDFRDVETDPAFRALIYREPAGGEASIDSLELSVESASALHEAGLDTLGKLDAADLSPFSKRIQADIKQARKKAGGR